MEVDEDASAVSAEAETATKQHKEPKQTEKTEQTAVAAAAAALPQWVEEWVRSSSSEDMPEAAVRENAADVLGQSETQLRSVRHKTLPGSATHHSIGVFICCVTCYLHMPERCHSCGLTHSFLVQAILQMQQALEAEEDAENPMDAAQRTYLAKLVQLSKKAFAKKERPAKLLAGWIEEATALGEQLTALSSGENIDDMLLGFMTMDPHIRGVGLEGMQSHLEAEPNVRAGCLRIGCRYCGCPPASCAS
jgi:hypothetical protein